MTRQEPKADGPRQATVRILMADGDAFDVTCVGFRGGLESGGIQAEGRVPRQARSGDEIALRRRDADTALFVKPGFSGAAVCDEALKVVAC